MMQVVEYCVEVCGVCGFVFMFDYKVSVMYVDGYCVMGQFIVVGIDVDCKVCCIVEVILECMCGLFC